MAFALVLFGRGLVFGFVAGRLLLGGEGELLGDNVGEVVLGKTGEETVRPMPGGEEALGWKPRTELNARLLSSRDTTDRGTATAPVEVKLRLKSSFDIPPRVTIWGELRLEREGEDRTTSLSRMGETLVCWSISASLRRITSNSCSHCTLCFLVFFVSFFGSVGRPSRR